MGRLSDIPRLDLLIAVETIMLALRIAWTVIIALGVMSPSLSHGGAKSYDLGVFLNQPHPFETSVADRPPPVRPSPVPAPRHRKSKASHSISIFGGWLTDNNFEEVFTPWELGFRPSAILGVAVLSTLGYTLVTKAIALAPARVVQPVNFMRMPIGAGFGWVLFSEFPDLWTWIGAVVIFCATTYAVQRGTKRE